MWKDWFFYSRRERNGIIVLVILLLVLLIARIFMPTLVEYEQYDYSHYQSKIDSFKQSLYQDSIRQIWLTEDHFNSDSLFTFDPNKMDSLTMRHLGFGLKSLDNILRYRNSGGSFNKAEDLGRIYSVSDSELIILTPYIKIKSADISFQSTPKTHLQTTAEAKVFIENKQEIQEPAIQVELNSADTALLKRLPGIGEVLSERIVKYRNWLGGFYSLDQLKEVYGLKPEVIEDISDQVMIDTMLLKKINVNETSVNQMKSHPYLNFYQTKAIYDYRRREKPVESFAELIKIEGIDTANLKKVRPYLEFSDSGTKE